MRDKSYCTINQVDWIPEVFSLEKKSRFGRTENTAKYLTIKQVIDRILTKDAEELELTLKKTTTGSGEAFVTLYPRWMFDELRNRVETEERFLTAWRKDYVCGVR